MTRRLFLCNRFHVAAMTVLTFLAFIPLTVRPCESSFVDTSYAVIILRDQAS